MHRDVGGGTVRPHIVGANDEDEVVCACVGRVECGDGHGGGIVAYDTVEHSRVLAGTVVDERGAGCGGLVDGLACDLETVLGSFCRDDIVCCACARKDGGCKIVAVRCVRFGTGSASGDGITRQYAADGDGGTMGGAIVDPGEVGRRSVFARPSGGERPCGDGIGAIHKGDRVVGIGGGTRDGIGADGRTLCCGRLQRVGGARAVDRSGCDGCGKGGNCVAVYRRRGGNRYGDGPCGDGVGAVYEGDRIVSVGSRTRDGMGADGIPLHGGCLQRVGGIGAVDRTCRDGCGKGGNRVAVCGRSGRNRHGDGPCGNGIGAVCKGDGVVCVGGSTRDGVGADGVALLSSRLQRIGNVRTVERAGSNGGRKGGERITVRGRCRGNRYGDGLCGDGVGAVYEGDGVVSAGGSTRDRVGAHRTALFGRRLEGIGRVGTVDGAGSNRRRKICNRRAVCARCRRNGHGDGSRADGQGAVDCLDRVVATCSEAGRDGIATHGIANRVGGGIGCREALSVLCACDRTGKGGSCFAVGGGEGAACDRESSRSYGQGAVDNGGCVVAGCVGRGKGNGIVANCSAFCGLHVGAGNADVDPCRCGRREGIGRSRLTVGDRGVSRREDDGTRSDDIDTVYERDGVVGIGGGTCDGIVCHGITLFDLGLEGIGRVRAVDGANGNTC